MSATHECPITACTTRVPHEHLMCPPHWRKVPRDLQHAVYAAYRRDDLIAHADACTEAIAAVERTNGWAMRGDTPTNGTTSSRERFGAGVCATGMCIEPCGENGGCIR